MTASYDPWLVLLSLAIASVAGYAALLIAERLRKARTGLLRAVWTAGGMLAMGSGIWTTHFVGMLACRMHMPVHYDPWITALSAVPGHIASGFALRFLVLRRPGFVRANLGGLVLGTGIAAMHYTGMTAMVMPAETRYDPTLLALSVLVAHVLATVALWIDVGIQRRRPGWRHPKAIAAIVMGCAVAGMHYTAMAAARFYPAPGAQPSPDVLMEPLGLALAVTGISGVVLACAIVSAIVDARLQEVSRGLRESEEQLRILFDTAVEGIVTIDDEGSITRFNQAAAAMFGWAPEDVLGEDATMLIPPAYAPRRDAWVARAAESGLSQIIGRTTEIEGLRRDGSQFPLALSVSESVVAGRRVLTAILRDLTDRRRLEAQLLQAQKLEAIGQLAAGIAHEINTPAQFVGDNLTFLAQSFDEVLGAFDACARIVDVAEEAGADGEAVTQARASIEAADIDFLRKEIPDALAQSLDGVARVSEIVRAMKDFSHPGSKQKRPIDVNAAIGNTLVVARNTWKYVAELETDLAADLPPVPGLPAELNQVLLNIVVNAAQAIAEELPEGEKGWIRIRTRQDDGNVRIDVSDSGPGMPEEVSTKVFDPFFTTKEVGKGSGQGLAIARSIVVDQHGGTIAVDSRPGEGTTFSIWLPVGDTPTDREESRDHAPA